MPEPSIWLFLLYFIFYICVLVDHDLGSKISYIEAARLSLEVTIEDLENLLTAEGPERERILKDRLFGLKML